MYLYRTIITMANVEIDKDVANELALYKLRNLQFEIQEILDKWKFNSIEDFLLQSKNGSLPESENDGIDLKQLVKEENDLNELLDQIKA